MQKIFLVLFLVLPIFACASNEPGAPVPMEVPDNAASSEKARELQAIIQSLTSDLEQAIGSASCSESSQCKALPVGAKACGGPKYYLPYSIQDANETKILKLSSIIKSKQREYNLLSNAVSDCSFLMPPEVACIDQTCVTIQ